MCFQISQLVFDLYVDITSFRDLSLKKKNKFQKRNKRTVHLFSYEVLSAGKSILSTMGNDNSKQKQDTTYEINEQSVDKVYYTINAPRTVRGNSNYTFVLTTHGAKGELEAPVEIRASIEDENNENGYKAQTNIRIAPNATEMVLIALGDLSPKTNYKLVLNGREGLNLKYELSLNLRIKVNAIFIETDKMVYKPNDCIKFQILVLDSNLKVAPSNQNKLSVFVSVSIDSNSLT